MSDTKANDEHKVIARQLIDGRTHSVDAEGPGYKIKIVPGQEPEVTIDHSKARIDIIKRDGEVETWKPVKK